jgi:hypothetical protein
VKSDNFMATVPNPHTSYHADGQLHHKSFGKYAVQVVYRPKPNRHFRGTEQILTTSITAKAARALPLCDVEHFNKVFKISIDKLDALNHTVGVVVDLVQPGCSGSTLWGGSRIRQQTFTDGRPWIVIGLWDMRA